MLPIAVSSPERAKAGLKAMRVFRSSLAATALVLFTLNAGAQEANPYPECTKEPSETDVAAAKAAYQAGSVSFNEADYPRAILYWEDAYRRDCTANPLLHNLARAYELNGQRRQAVVALETYLARDPNNAEKAPITRRIEVLKKQIESEQQAAATPATAPAATPAPTATPTTEPGPAPRPRSKSFPTFPVVIIGVGGVMVIVGGLAYADASSKVKGYESHCDDPAQRQGCPSDEIEAANDARKRQNVSLVVTVLGLPVIAGGILWTVLSSSGDDPKTAERPRLSPAVAQNFLGLSLDGEF